MTHTDVCRAVARAYKGYSECQKLYATPIPWYKRLFGYCPWCGRYFRYKVSTEIRNTQYADPASNWITACKDCRDEDYAYFEELWKEYNAGRL